MDPSVQLLEAAGWEGWDRIFSFPSQIFQFSPISPYQKTEKAPVSKLKRQSPNGLEDFFPISVPFRPVSPIWCVRVAAKDVPQESLARVKTREYSANSAIPLWSGWVARVGERKLSVFI